MAFKKLLDVKTSVVKIKNKDELHWTCAIITMIAYCDVGSRQPGYTNLQQGFPVQEKKPRNSTVPLEYPKDRVAYPKSPPFNIISSTITSQCSSKSFSRVPSMTITNTPSSSRWGSTTTGAIPSRASLDMFIFTSSVKCHTYHQTRCINIFPNQSACHQCSRCHRAFFGGQC